VALQPDDRPAFPDPPAGFDVSRPEIYRGRLETVEYDSKTVGTRRRLQVYLPPRLPSEQPYPVLYFSTESAVTKRNGSHWRVSR
jgi:enterochelin esterase-like enzyme